MEAPANPLRAPAFGRQSVPRIGRQVATAVSPQLRLLYVMWAIVLFEPQWLAAWYGPDAILRVPIALFAVLAVMAVAKGPREWCVPFAMIVALGLATAPMTFDLGKSLTGIKPLIFFYVLAVSTLRLVETPRQTLPILLALFVTQFVWWGLWGTRAGLIEWHYNYNNYDAFGPLMAIGMASSFYYALATPNRRWRLVGFGTSLLCVLGLVSSFARGAVLTGVLVMGYMWLRSRRKALMAGALVVGMIVVAIGGTIFAGASRGGDTQSTFWAEMATVQKGTDDATGSDRKQLWKAAWLVFLDNPILGAGVENFGPYAAENIKPGQVGGAYGENPKKLYDRALHSSYAQILSELGLVGSSLFIWLLADFWIRNGKLREPRSLQRWAAGNTKLDLAMLSYAIEGGMVAFLGTAFFYNQLWNNWFWSLLIVNWMLYQLVQVRSAALPGGMRSSRVAAVRRASIG